MSGVYKGFVRTFNTVTKQVTAVIPQLFGTTPVTCDPFLSKESNRGLVAPVVPGDRVTIIWDGDQTNAVPEWLPGIGTDDYWNRSWGNVGTVLPNQIYALTGTDTVFITQDVKTYVGRRYRASFSARAMEIVRGDGGTVGAIIFKLRRDGSTAWGTGGTADDRYVNTMTSGIGYGGSTVTWEFEGNGIISTYALSAGVTSPSTSGNLHAQAGPASVYSIEDIGPVSASVAPFIPDPIRPPVSAGNALGVVYVGTVLTPQPITVATGGTGTLTAPLTWTSTLGRRYRINFVARATSGTGAVASQNRYYIWNGTAQVDNDRWVDTSANYNSANLSWLLNGDGSTPTYTIRVDATAAASSVFFPTQFYIEDVGPANNPALPLDTRPPAWEPFVMAGTWTNYDGGAAWEVASFRKVGDIVKMQGLVKNTGTSVGAPTIVGTLPIYARPVKNHLFLAHIQQTGFTSVQVSRIDVGPDGIVYIRPINTATVDYMNLDAITFSTTAM